ncbi:MAG: lysine 2,3-aminomutase [Syntrophaceae bacterium]|nr:lysine 2,3-aminomutase [Syntrophaceae bacterium]
MTLSHRQEQILKTIDPSAGVSDWRNWKWQMRHCVRDIETFEKLMNISFTDEMRRQFRLTEEKFPMSVTPYYLSLISDKEEEIFNDPVFRQCFPSPLELNIMEDDMADPLHEDQDSPVPGLTHRYPDRVLFLVSNMCAMYCRHCTRKRRVGDIDSVPSRSEIMAGIDYIRNTPRVRDVLLSGGDPLMLSDDYLDWILSELRKIPHVEIIRIGTRTPVVLPYRITDNLVDVLKKYHPLWLNTHFNHPRELTGSSRDALARLANAGIPLGNQSVLLAGINDCTLIMRALVNALVANRVRPYYLYQCDLSEGLSHFRTPVGKGIEILESLIGHTSGLCVPTYVIDAPGGGGKVPVMPNYLISWSPTKVVLRNYEGVITTYKEPDHYEPIVCNRDCDSCILQHGNDYAEDYEDLGIGKLLADHDKTISLIPADNERYARRDA